MIQIKNYIEEIIGLDFDLQPLDKSVLNQLPIYLRNTYQWYELYLLNKRFIIAHTETDEDFTIAAIDNQLDNIEEKLQVPIILSVNEIEAYNRKRLIEKKRAFIVPYKQMYIPYLFIDLTEFKYQTKGRLSERLQPFAQVIVIAHLLNTNYKYQIEDIPLKEIANLFQVNTINVSRAVENLVDLNLIEIINRGRYKMFRFTKDRTQLWKYGLEKDIFINPISKQYFTEFQFNWNQKLLSAGDTALTDYTNINPSDQIILATDHPTFNLIKKNNDVNMFNKFGGRFCIQIWKYDPKFMNRINHSAYNNVDPISLYLTYKDDRDERVQIELEQLINRFVW